MTARLLGSLGIVALAAIGGMIYRSLARERRRRAAHEEITRWEGEGGAVAESPATPYEPRPA